MRVTIVSLGRIWSIQQTFNAPISYTLCRIVPVNRRKAVVRDWFGNGEPVNIMGEIEMYQMSEYDAVNVEVNVQGLQQVNEYRIHMVSLISVSSEKCEFRIIS